MELPGSGYLYTLALLAITYGGFAALFMLFRQELAGRMIDYEAFLIRGVVQKGFIVAACSMVPPLLAYFDLAHSTIWRVSSLIAGALQVLFLATWVARRRTVSDIPTSKWLTLNLLLQLVTAIFLFVGATGLLFAAGPGAFLVGVTAILFLSGIAYQEALVFLLHDSPRKRSKR